jgi:hypothetical protein
MSTNNKLPHPWCENTVSHHGVDLAAPLIILEGLEHSHYLFKISLNFENQNHFLL